MPRPATAAPAKVSGGQLSALFHTAHTRSLRERAPQSYAEVDRICKLPVILEPTAEECEAFSEQEVLAKAYEEGFRLAPPQVGALLAFDCFGAVFGSIGVGHGKTLIDIMVAERASRAGKRKILLLVPASGLEQFWDYDLGQARRWVPVTVPFYAIGVGPAGRAAVARSDRRGVYVMAYSILRCPDAHDILEALRPEVVIADEAHELSNPEAAQTKRMRHYIKDHRPQVVDLSGTMSRKSVMNFWHLACDCLGLQSPLPLAKELAVAWSQVVDADAEAPSRAARQPLVPLVDWARGRFPREVFTESVPGFRKAFRLRFQTAPGVVSTGDNEIGTSLVVHDNPVEQQPNAALTEHLGKLEDLWQTPNGDEIEHAIQRYKWHYELSAGFYYSLTWPTPEAFAARSDLVPSVAQAEEFIEKSKQHHAAVQVYHKVLRDWLKTHSRARLDSPMLVARSISKDGYNSPVGEELVDLYRHAKSLIFDGMPERDSTPVRVDDYKIQHATAWARGLPTGEGAIVWYYHQEMGRWLTEVMREAGIDALYCPAGTAGNVAIRDKRNAGRVAVASIRAHGRIKNLQFYTGQLVVQWPRSATHAQQMLGRVHRRGQKRDVVVVDTMHASEFDRQNFSACLNDATYVQQTMGERQKLVYATYVPRPSVYPSEWLNERGFQVSRLTPQQQQWIMERFKAVDFVPKAQ